MAHLTPEQEAKFIRDARNRLKLAGDAGSKVTKAAGYLSIVFPLLGLISFFKPGAKDIKAFRINVESGKELLWRSAELREAFGFGAPTKASLDRIHTAQDSLLISGQRPQVTADILSFWAAGKPADFKIDLGAVRRGYYGGIRESLYGGRLPYFLGGLQAPPGLRPGEKTFEELGLGKWFKPSKPGDPVPIGFSLNILSGTGFTPSASFQHPVPAPVPPPVVVAPPVVAAPPVVQTGDPIFPAGGTGGVADFRALPGVPYRVDPTTGAVSYNGATAPAQTINYFYPQPTSQASFSYAAPNFRTCAWRISGGRWYCA